MSRRRESKVEEKTMGEAHSTVQLQLKTSTKMDEVHSTVRLGLNLNSAVGRVLFLTQRRSGARMRREI